MLDRCQQRVLTPYIYPRADRAPTHSGVVEPARKAGGRRLRPGAQPHEVDLHGRVHAHAVRQPEGMVWLEHNHPDPSACIVDDRIPQRRGRRLPARQSAEEEPWWRRLQEEGRWPHARGRTEPRRHRGEGHVLRRRHFPVRLNVAGELPRRGPHLAAQLANVRPPRRLLRLLSSHAFTLASQRSGVCVCGVTTSDGSEKMVWFAARRESAGGRALPFIEKGQRQGPGGGGGHAMRTPKCPSRHLLI